MLEGQEVACSFSVSCWYITSYHLPLTVFFSLKLCSEPECRVKFKYGTNACKVNGANRRIFTAVQNEEKPCLLECNASISTNQGVEQSPISIFENPKYIKMEEKRKSRGLLRKCMERRRPRVRSTIKSALSGANMLTMAMLTCLFTILI